MPRRALSWTGFQQTVGDVLAAYGVHGQGLSQVWDGRQFRIGILKVIPKDEWVSLDQTKRERVLARMEKDARRVRALFSELRRESLENTPPSACFRSLLGSAEYEQHGSSSFPQDLGEAYGRMLLGEIPATNDEATVVNPHQVAPSSSASAPPSLPSYHLSPPTHSAYSMRPPPVPSATTPEAVEETQTPALDLRTSPYDLLYSFGANRFLQTSYAHHFLEGLRTVLPKHSWVQLMDAPGYGDCQTPFERVQQDAEKLKQAWERTPAAHKSGKAAFKAVCEALLGRLVTDGILKEVVEQKNAKIIGEAYAVMLASLAMYETIHLPSLRDLAFRHGQIFPSALESLGASRPHRSSPFVPVSRASRW
ncbi:hypothetical protein RTBOTA2_005749 [Rhodotorula toruloides]|nr:hypothetical protein RTBOTA2_005749 [Rhodotorula toruloides]